MRFDVVGDPGNPMVLMLPGSFCTGDTLRPIADRLSGSYCVVLVTLDGHVRGGGDYLSKEDATDKVVGWLRDRGVGHLAMAHGTSMGAINALDIAREGSIASDVWFFDGGPFFDFPKPVELAVRAALRRTPRSVVPQISRSTGGLRRMTDRRAGEAIQQRVYSCKNSSRHHLGQMT
jgi:pimeloyl-ACP methyl ester carboxylesterase